MLQLDSVTFAYRKQPSCLHELSLTLKAGKTLGLLGPNGAGKTTLVSLLIGQRSPTSGHITIADQPARLGRTDVALVPQEYAFYGRLSACENLDFFAGLLGLTGERKRHKIDQALAQTELTQYSQQKASTFSGGLKRRLNFAIALLQDPKLLLLDEPTANVDPQSRAFLLDIITQQKAQGTAIIYTSHLLAEVEAIADQVALLQRGRIVLQGSLKELLQEKGRILEIKLSQPASAKVLEALALTALPDGWYRSDLVASGLSLAEAMLQLEQLSAKVQQCRYGHHRLDDLYLKSLTDAEANP